MKYATDIVMQVNVSFKTVKIPTGKVIKPDKVFFRYFNEGRIIDESNNPVDWEAFAKVHSSFATAFITELNEEFNKGSLPDWDTSKEKMQ